VSIGRVGSQWHVALGRRTPAPTQLGRYLDFLFTEGTVRLHPGPSDAPAAYWIQPPPDRRLSSYPFATPLRLKPAAQGWTASVPPLQPSRGLRLIFESAEDGTRSAFIREDSRNYAGGRRFSVTQTGDLIRLTDPRGPSRSLSARLIGKRLG